MDMVLSIANKLKEKVELAQVSIKPYYRPESLPEREPSVVIIPLESPRQNSYGGDRPLRKEFTYQINVESGNLSEVKRLARIVEEVLLDLDFFQLPEGLDEYFVETRRYVDSRRYRGYSSIYQIDY